MDLGSGDKKTGFSAKDQNWFTRLKYTGQLTTMAVIVTMAIPSAIFGVLALLSLEPVGLIKPVEFSLAGTTVPLGTTVDFIIFAILTCTGVYGIYQFFRLRRVRKIDDRFPDFVRDLAESRRAGMTFTKAIMHSAKGSYGVLTSEIEKIARQISWGSSVDDALKNFAKRVNTKLVQRTVSLIIEASRSGGNVADVLEAASKDARELRLIHTERRANMMSYVAVIYVGMGVFLLILVILCKSFLPSIVGEAGQSLQQGAMGASGNIGMSDLENVFYAAALFQGFFMGFVTGVFEDGNIEAGVKHTFIMVMIGWTIFKFFIGV
ncbi:MAG: type II secretion system F family protein [Candidatus Thermoplasmatota archaeon]